MSTISFHGAAWRSTALSSRVDRGSRQTGTGSQLERLLAESGVHAVALTTSRPTLVRNEAFEESNSRRHRATRGPQGPAIESPARSLLAPCPGAHGPDQTRSGLTSKLVMDGLLTNLLTNRSDLDRPSTYTRGRKSRSVPAFRTAGPWLTRKRSPTSLGDLPAEVRQVCDATAVSPLARLFVSSGACGPVVLLVQLARRLRASAEGVAGSGV